MKGSKLNWSKLRENKCPRCYLGLSFDAESKMIKCSSRFCTFTCSETKMAEICGDRNKQALERGAPLQEDGEDIKKGLLDF